MSTHKRIGVLLVEDGEFWGGMDGLWKHYLSRFGQHSDGIELVPINAISGSLPDENSLLLFDGFIITGSNYSVNDNHKWISDLMIFIQRVIREGQHKIFGICFGHQLLAKVYGGLVGRNIGGKDVFNTQSLQLSNSLQEKDYYRKVFGNRKSFRIMEAHGESITHLEGDFEVVGWSTNCQYEMILWNDDIISVQGHPEFTVDVCVNKIAPMVKEHKFLSDEDLEISLKTFTDIDTNKTVMFVKSFLSR